MWRRSRRARRRWFCRDGVLVVRGFHETVALEGVGGVGGGSDNLNVVTVGHDEAGWEFLLELVEDGLEGHAVEKAAPAATLPASHFVGDDCWGGVDGDENGRAGAVHEAEERFKVWAGACDGPHHAAIVCRKRWTVGPDGNVGCGGGGINGSGHEVASAGDADAELFGLGGCRGSRRLSLLQARPRVGRRQSARERFRRQ